jgi:circadian clock protein KaiC
MILTRAMADKRGPLNRLSTGIPGLDPLLEGGLLKGGVYIVQGPPGAGKTIFGNQICFHVAATGGQAVYVTLLAESHTRMLGHLARMKFCDPAAVGSRVYYVSGFKVLEGEGLAGLLKVIRSTVTGHHATFLVLDGLLSAEEASPSDKDYKKFIHELQTFTEMVGTTAVLLGSTARQRGGFHPEHTMVDGIIDLTDELADLRAIRRLQVRKLRGTRQVRGQHTLEISDEGIRVRPRIESQLAINHAANDDVTASADRKAFGIARLDEMMMGGVPAASMTLLLGPSGSGKTTLGLKFLADGAARGEPGLFFGFYERPQSLIVKGERLRFGTREALETGLLHIQWQLPIEGVIDVLGHRLLDAVRAHGIRRLVIDGIHGFQIAAEFPSRVRSVFSAFAEELEALQVTTVYTMETPDLFGPRIEAPVSGLSAVTHNIILLRHVELRSRLYRLISVLKLRDSAHDSAICEFRIDESGVTVADTFDGADQVMSGSAQEPRGPAVRRKGQEKRKRRS